MVTPKFICGAECGIAVTGTASGGTEHWASVGTTQSIVTSGPSSMRSTRCFRMNPTNAAGYFQHTFASAIASPATIVTRFYVYFTTLPNADVLLWSSNSIVGLAFKQSDSTLRACGATTSNMASDGKVITTGVWYCIDLKGVRNTTTTCDLSVDGEAQTQYSVAGSAGTLTGASLGPQTSVTCDMYVDDYIVSGTSGDFPIGPGTVVGLYPNGDKTNSSSSATNDTTGNGGHIYNAVGDFGKGSGGGTDLGAQNVESTSYQSLSKPLSTSVATNFISDRLGASTEHLVWTLEDLPSDATAVNGVMLVATSHSASSTANNQSMKVKNASNQLSTAWSVLDLSESTITVPCAVITDPASGSWDVTKVNEALIQWGDSSDVTPDAYLDGVCLEVDYKNYVSLTPVTITLSAQAILAIDDSKPYKVCDTVYDSGDNSEACRLTYPSGIQADDVAIWAMGIASGGNLTAPTGWSNIGSPISYEGSNIDIHLWYKVLDGTESGYTGYPGHVNYGATYMANMTVWRNADPSDFVDVSGGANTSKNGTYGVDAPSVTAGVASLLLCFFAANKYGSTVNATWSPPSGMNEVTDQNYITTAVIGLGSASLSLSATGATGVKTATWSLDVGNACGASIVINPKPQAPSTTLTPATITLTPVALSESVGGVSTTLGVVSTTLTPVALTKSVGGVSTTLGIVSVSLTPVAVTTSINVSTTLGVASVTLTPVALTKSVGGVSTTLGVVNTTLTPVVLTTSANVSTTLGVVSISLTSIALSYSLGTSSRTLGTPSITLTPLVLVGAGTGDASRTLSQATVTLTPVALTKSVGGVTSTLGIATITLSSVALTTSGDVTTTLGIVSVSLTPVLLTTSGNISTTLGVISVSLTSVGLSYSLSTADNTLGIVSVSLTLVGLSYSLGTSSRTLGIVSVSLTPIALVGAASGSASRDLTATTINLTPIVLTSVGSGDAPVSITPAIITLNAFPISGAAEAPPSETNLAPVVLTLSGRPLTGSGSGDTSTTINSITLTVTAVALTRGTDTIGVTLSPVGYTLSVLGLSGNATGDASRSLTSAALSLTAVSLTRGTDTTAVTISPVVCTLTAYALTGSGTGTVSRTLTEVTLTLTPVVLSRATDTVLATVSPISYTLTAFALTSSIGGISGDVAPVTMSLSAVSLNVIIGDVGVTLVPAVINLLPIALVKMIGDASGTITPVVLSLNAFPISGYAEIPGVGNIAPVVLTLSGVALTGSGTGDVSCTINHVSLTIFAVELSISEEIVTSISSVFITFVPVSLTYSVGGVSRDITPVSLTLSAISCVYSLGTASTTITSASLTLNPVGFTWSIGTINVSIVETTLILSPVEAVCSVGNVSVTINPTDLMLLPVVLTILAVLGGKIKVWNGNQWVDKPIKVWMGDQWAEKPLKVWTGDTWELT